MYTQTHSVTVTTDGDGDGIGYTPPIRGQIREIVYVKDDYAAGVDFTITTNTTGRTVWTQENVDASANVQPRRPCHGTDGAALYFNDEGDEPVTAPIAMGGELLKIVVAAGGANKSGTFHVVCA